MALSLTDRRRADRPHVAGDHLVLYRPGGVAARMAVVVDQLDDTGLRTPLIEDVLTAFPHGELFVVDDRREAVGSAVAGRRPTPLSATPDARSGWLGLRWTVAKRPRALPSGHDVVLRIGDRRTRGFRVPHDALDLTYILDLAADAADEGRLGAGYRDRCALQSADIVWAGSRRLLAALRRRWQVDAQLLYPAAEPPVPAARAAIAPRVVALIDGAPLEWVQRLESLAGFRPDLTIVAYGSPAPAERRCRTVLERHPRVDPADFLADVEGALALLAPPGDVFDPRLMWAQVAGVPVIGQAQSAAAEVVRGLDHREPTGIMVDEATDETLADAVAFVEANRPLWPVERLMVHAQRWSRARFRRTLKSLVFDAWCVHLAAATAVDDVEAAPSDAEAALHH